MALRRSVVCLFLLHLLAVSEANYRDVHPQETVSSCSEGYETCARTRRCILSTWICDGEDDCGDNSDEPDSCVTRVCAADQLRCDSGQCLDKEAFCIGLVACTDASIKPKDVCPKTCPYAHVLCPRTGRCIRELWLCDGDDDCGDNWDESKDTCRERACADSQIKCNSGQCLDAKRFCSGLDDCRDGTKIQDVCPSVACEPGWSKCPTVNKCIKDSWFCDMSHDCADGSDEDAIACANRECPTGSLRCDSGQCVALSSFCRHEETCRDKSLDEKQSEICDGVERRLLKLLQRRHYKARD